VTLFSRSRTMDLSKTQERGRTHAGKRRQKNHLQCIDDNSTNSVFAIITRSTVRSILYGRSVSAYAPSIEPTPIFKTFTLVNSIQGLFFCVFLIFRESMTGVSVITTITLGFYLLTVAQSLPVYWIGGGGGSDWDNPLNWNPRVPGSGDDVLGQLESRYLYPRWIES
jgi:hypothetical protein